MIVVFDGRGAVRYRGTGIGTYTNALIEGLIATKEPGDVLVVLLPRGAQPLEVEDAMDSCPSTGVHFWRLRSVTRQDEEQELSEVCAEGRADVLHMPQNGRGLPHVECAVVTTVHDLIPYLLPQTCSPSYLHDCLEQLPWIVERSDRLVAVSRHTARSLVEVLGVAEEKIAVIHEAPPPVFDHPPAESEVATVVAQLGLPKSYILHTGGTSRRKNLPALLMAMAQLKKSAPENARLPAVVLTGRDGPERQRLIELAGQLGFDDGSLYTPGMIVEEALPAVYAAAQAVVCPSLHEGFGLPVVEGMAAGTPLVISDIPAHREVAGPAAVYFDPYRPETLSSALADVLWQPRRRKALTEAARKRLGSFSWRRAARETWMTYRWASEVQ